MALGGAEVGLALACGVLFQLACDHASAMAYVEAMLYAQLSDAVGKELTAEAFEQYMAHHERALYTSEFRPKPFSYAVRRDAAAFPDGLLSIEQSTADGRQPVMTSSRLLSSCSTRDDGGAPPMHFALGAAVDVGFYGERRVHAYTRRAFGDTSQGKLTLVARARQFSSFLLLLGKVVRTPWVRTSL